MWLLCSGQFSMVPFPPLIFEFRAVPLRLSMSLLDKADNDTGQRNDLCPYVRGSIH